MGEIAISLNNVSKCFKRYRHPVDRLKEILLPGKVRADEFWALSHINLELPKGKTLGIVGRNGSGKSTLLQIIVGTLAPTEGQVNVKGRISALLELGSGFNPEFTGRQNVFFNGQLLGLSQSEIEDKFDEIVAFADIGDFLDQPVKTYSSGMFVRLAFAVATSVDPDILVVDEALSVGDEAFQRKCFARIETIQERGGTILFVSHAAAMVVELCDSAILMHDGELLLYHTPKTVVDKYQKLIYAPPGKVEKLCENIRQLNRDKGQESVATELAKLSANSSVPPAAKWPGVEQAARAFFDEDLQPKNTIHYESRGAEIIDPHILTLGDKKVNYLVGRHEYVYTYTVEFFESATQVRFGMLIKTISGLDLGGASYPFSEKPMQRVEAGRKVVVKFRFKCLLNPGVYFLNAGVSGIVNGDFTYMARCIDVAMFKVQQEGNLSATGTVDLLVKPSVALVESEADPKPKQIELI
ncbi:ABC transporter ATP-binding protein [Phormidium sp. CCY1219]|uniref:ABC transporter ATP-binding protein n=1 Tax=Phormidium sp. CCY1219 TaxID=2886104 RepID=UPI002D1F999D|nr:ABC transporter ATP-binding protein [Phormidium sp. CCY1219]MEB3830432.1 ABC transporter ATP-binding protein [Phormidium sp. CCY1219]